MQEQKIKRDGSTAADPQTATAHSEPPLPVPLLLTSQSGAGGPKGPQPPPLPTAHGEPAADTPPSSTMPPPPVPETNAPKAGARKKDDSPVAAAKSSSPEAVVAASDQAKRAAEPADSQPDPVAPPRRVARRRPAGPVRNRIAANDDAPSIGGLIYALEQKPSNKPFTFAAIASATWVLLGAAVAWVMASGEFAAGATLVQLLMRPTTFLVFAAIIVPIGLSWLMALLAWRAEELRLRSSTMAEVAVRLAEPDRMAEQSIASLGQAVRRQVSFMNDAVSRALGRAGELEALVHSEVAALERSYEENERKIRSLITELSGERTALVNTSDTVSHTLRSLGSEVPALIEKLSTQQVKLAHLIQSAGDNLTTLEGAIDQATGRFETSLGSRTQHLQTVLEDYTAAIGHALGSRTEEMQALLGTYSEALGGALEARTANMGAMLDQRTQNMQTVFEEYTRALDGTIASRADTLDSQLVERVKALDSAFGERLRLFDEAIQHSTRAIDASVNEKATALTSALDQHARTFSQTVDRQAAELDETLLRGINSVRRSSENITRQSIKAIEGLASQSEMLKSVSDNLLGQIHNVTSRFEKQGQQILGAASALESANYKIDTTLQNRHADLSRTLDRLSGKADEFGRFLEGYSSSIEGSLTEAELRARQVAEELQRGTEQRQRDAMAELARIRSESDAQSERTLADLRNRVSSVSNEMSQQLGSLSSRFDETTEQVRRQAARTAQELAEEQARLRRELEQMPATTRESADAVRRALQDQLKALDQLSTFTNRKAAERDVTPPLPGIAPPGGGEPGRGVPSLSSALAHELSQRQRQPAPEPSGHARAHGGLPASPAPSASPAQDSRAGWSLGDLLARASHDDDAPDAKPPQAAPAPAYTLDIAAVARALDATAASAIWSRVRAGQRNIMVRSIYTTDGRVTFDEISRRYKVDADLRSTIDRYLVDFERLLRDSDAKDPSGRQAHAQITSDGGRVYLFLAHAAGRLA